MEYETHARHRTQGTTIGTTCNSTDARMRAALSRFLGICAAGIILCICFLATHATAARLDAPAITATAIDCDCHDKETSRCVPCTPPSIPCLTTQEGSCADKTAVFDDDGLLQPHDCDDGQRPSLQRVPDMRRSTTATDDGEGDRLTVDRRADTLCHDCTTDGTRRHPGARRGADAVILGRGDNDCDGSSRDGPAMRRARTGECDDGRRLPDTVGHHRLRHSDNDCDGTRARVT